MVPFCVRILCRRWERRFLGGTLKEKFLNFFSEWKYEIAIFIFLITFGLFVAPSFCYVAKWPFSFYLLDYKLGFGSRLLIGSIFNFIFKGFLRYETVGLIVFCFTSFFCLLISLFLGKIVKRAEKSERNLGVLFLVLLYLALPTRFSSYFHPDFMGYLEIYIFGLVLLMIYLFLNKRQNWLFWGLISLLCAVCVAIHQVFLCIMFPIIFAIMIYNLYENKWKKDTLIGTLAVCIVTSIAFLYFQFFSSLNVPLNTLILIASKRTNLYCEYSYLHLLFNCEYYASIYDKFVGTMTYVIKNIFNPILLTSAVVIFSPLFIILGKIWKNIYKNCEEKTEKTTFNLILSCNLLFLPVFIMACDWGRWFIWFVTFQFAVLFVLYWKQNKSVVLAIEQFGDFVKENQFLMVLLLLFYMIMYMNLFNIIMGFTCFY